MYKPGTICTFVNLVCATQYNGTDCEVLECLGVQKGNRLDGVVVEGLMYFVKACDGQVSYALHETLKLKRPPKDEKFEEFMQNLLKPVEIPDEEVMK